MNIIELAFEKATGIPDAWKNLGLMQARNGFIQGWELAVAHEREECAKLFDNKNIWAEEISQTIRARGKL